MWGPPFTTFLAINVDLVQWALLTLEGLLEAEVRGKEQDIIQYLGQLVLPNISIEGWIIDPYVHSFLDGPGEDM